MSKNKPPRPPLGNGLYVLDKDGLPVVEPDGDKWTQWLEDHSKECMVRQDELPGGIRVVTIFTGMDCQYRIDPTVPPKLWVTTIVGSPHDQKERYSSREEALAGHSRALEWIRKSIR